MQMGFRWYGEGNDKISLNYIKQIPGVSSIVWALHHKMPGEVGEDDEIEDVCMMKTFKPSVNDKFAETNKLFVVKIAEDVMSEDGTIKTLKYVLPAFADNSNQLQQIMQDYISQGFENMRLTTISETKWIYI